MTTYMWESEETFLGTMEGTLAKAEDTTAQSGVSKHDTYDDLPQDLRNTMRELVTKEAPGIMTAALGKSMCSCT